tara:strand:+ start:247 stop:555 length:309 start_codon:yes stop_codon:yes gene_type:complete
MENNKLIAKFMGYEVKHGKCYSPKYNDGTIAPMQFDKSWDWLMPVVQKCRLDGQNLVGIDNWSQIGSALDECNIDKTYKAVVEFIKDWPHAPYTDVEGNTYI